MVGGGGLSWYGGKGLGCWVMILGLLSFEPKLLEGVLGCRIGRLKVARLLLAASGLSIHFETGKGGICAFGAAFSGFFPFLCFLFFLASDTQD